MIDHLPQAVPPAEPAARKSYEQDLQALSRRSNVFVKGSEVLRQVNGKVPDDSRFLQAMAGRDLGHFRRRPLLFGSDWPNSDHLAPYADTFDIIRQYVLTRDSPLQKNSSGRTRSQFMDGTSAARLSNICLADSDFGWSSALALH